MLSVLSQVYTFRRGEGQAFLRFFLRFVRGCAILFVELNRKQQVRSVTLPHRAAAGTLKGKRVQIPHDLVTVIRESTVRVLLHRSLSHPAWEGGSGRRALSQETCLLLVPGLCRPRSRGIGCTKKPVRYGVFLLCHFASKRPRFLQLLFPVPFCSAPYFTHIRKGKAR